MHVKGKKRRSKKKLPKIYLEPEVEGEAGQKKDNEDEESGFEVGRL
jgi:hypothetical protein